VELAGEVVEIMEPQQQAQVEMALSLAVVVVVVQAIYL
jgi:hypothetical protein